MGIKYIKNGRLLWNILLSLFLRLKVVSIRICSIDRDKSSNATSEKQPTANYNKIQMRKASFQLLFKSTSIVEPSTIAVTGSYLFEMRKSSLLCILHKTIKSHSNFFAQLYCQNLNSISISLKQPIDHLN